jgi:hypothetical protein
MATVEATWSWDTNTHQVSHNSPPASCTLVPAGMILPSSINCTLKIQSYRLSWQSSIFLTFEESWAALGWAFTSLHFHTVTFPGGHYSRQARKRQLKINKYINKWLLQLEMRDVRIWNSLNSHYLQMKQFESLCSLNGFLFPPEFFVSFITLHAIILSFYVPKYITSI